MVKYKLLFATLLGVIATGQLMCMEDRQEERLNFHVNPELKIEEYSAQGMSYFKLPNEFAGKNILDAIPLSESDRKKLANGFGQAEKDKITVGVFYTLDNKKYVAKITPLFKVSNKKSSFFIKVTENK